MRIGREGSLSGAASKITLTVCLCCNAISGGTNASRRCRLLLDHEPEPCLLAGRDLGWLLKIELLDPEASFGDFVGRYAKLFEIAIGLAEVALEIENTVLETADVFEKAHDLDLDEAGLLAH